MLEHLEYGKKLMDTATKTEIDVAKNASKKSCLKKEEATEKLVANKTGGKIISAGSKKKKKKENKKKMDQMKYKIFIYLQKNFNKLLIL